MSRPPLPPDHDTVLTKEPVRVAWIIYGALQGIVAVLLGADVISAQVGGILTGIGLVVYGAVSELFVRQAVVPLKPLNRLVATTEEQVAEAVEDVPRPPPPPST